MHHPLLEDISVHNAAGIIANFTAGSDLTLLEVNSALNYLQARSNADAKIVMGTTVDNRMQDRVQVILVVTGLGATSLEDVLPGAEQKIARKQPVQVPQEQNTSKNAEPEVLRIPEVAAATNLDIPASRTPPTALRRRLIFEWSPEIVEAVCKKIYLDFRNRLGLSLKSFANNLVPKEQRGPGTSTLFDLTFSLQSTRGQWGHNSSLGACGGHATGKK